MIPHRYFYHAFPQAPSGKDGLLRGISILGSILDRGLVLTPEVLEHDRSNYRSISKRVCFTELGPGELAAHAVKFGPFALEWEYETLLRMGALPVIYFPLVSDPKTAAASEAFYETLGGVAQLLERLLELNRMGEAMLPGEHLNLDIDGRQVPTSLERAHIQQLSRVLEYGALPMQSMLNGFRALTSLVQRTNDPRSDDVLAFFREREWRIVGNMTREGALVTDKPSDADAEALVSLSPEYFGRTMRFRTGEYRIIDQCQIYRQFDGKPLHKSLRRVIVPAEVLSEASELVASRGVTVSIAAMEEVSA